MNLDCMRFNNIFWWFSMSLWKWLSTNGLIKFNYSKTYSIYRDNLMSMIQLMNRYSFRGKIDFILQLTYRLFFTQKTSCLAHFLTKLKFFSFVFWNKSQTKIQKNVLLGKHLLLFVSSHFTLWPQTIKVRIGVNLHTILNFIQKTTE